MWNLLEVKCTYTAIDPSRSNCQLRDSVPVTRSSQFSPTYIYIYINVYTKRHACFSQKYLTTKMDGFIFYKNEWFNI